MWRHLNYFSDEDWLSIPQFTISGNNVIDIGGVFRDTIDEFIREEIENSKLFIVDDFGVYFLAEPGSLKNSVLTLDHLTTFGKLFAHYALALREISWPPILNVSMFLIPYARSLSPAVDYIDPVEFHSSLQREILEIFESWEQSGGTRAKRDELSTCIQLILSEQPEANIEDFLGKIKMTAGVCAACLE